MIFRINFSKLLYYIIGVECIDFFVIPLTFSTRLNRPFQNSFSSPYKHREYVKQVEAKDPF